ncbi:MAG: competence ComEA-like helix-hairpin-helix protein [Kiritimatiellia bacterium]|jgi:competence ComEA-like helix-hairpin-helix protein
MKMGIRSTFGSLFGQSEAAVREVVEQVLANKGYARPSDIQGLRDELVAVRAEIGQGSTDDDASARLSAAETQIAGLSKKLSMAMGAIQAATAQLADVRRTADGSRIDALKALQRASTALATVESLADGVDGIESTVERLKENLAAPVGAAPATTAPATPANGAPADVTPAKPAPVKAAKTDDRVDINVADLNTLESVPGIGPSMAQRILDDRVEHGSYTNLSHLSRVKGLGAGTVKKLGKHLRV